MPKKLDSGVHDVCVSALGFCFLGQIFKCLSLILKILVGLSELGPYMLSRFSSLTLWDPMTCTPARLLCLWAFSRQE